MRRCLRQLPYAEAAERGRAGAVEVPSGGAAVRRERRCGWAGVGVVRPPGAQRGAQGSEAGAEGQT
eukprot:9514335-Alexandrium_andersonii.AAC.1